MFNMNHFKVEESEFLLLTGEGNNGLGHLKYWVPELLKIKAKFSILVRNEQLLKKARNEYRMVNILLAKSALDVEETFTKLPKLKAIFYMSNPINNIHALRFNKYRHIFLGSENSDRDAQVSKVIRVFDELWLTSQASIDKISPYIDISPLTIKKIGKPQFKHLTQISNKDKENSVLFVVSNNNYHESDASYIKEVLESIPVEYHIDMVIDKALDKKTPLLDSLTAQINELNWQLGRDCTIYDTMTDDILLRNKFIICDLNSYQLKFLATNALVCMYIPNHISPETLFPKKYLSFDGVIQFSDKLELAKAFIEYDSLYTKQQEFAEYWIGNSYTISNEFLKVIGDL